MPKSTIYGCFFFKASHAQELMESKTDQPTQVEAVKVIQLSAQQLRHFTASLLRDMPFITANKSFTSCGEDAGSARQFQSACRLEKSPGTARAEDAKRGLFLLDQVYKLIQQIAKK